MQAERITMTGEGAGSIELDDTVWSIEPNIGVMHQALVMQQANARLGTHDTKTRGEVRGGGRKPWRQKGTGRARQGSTRSPQWVGGGVVWGPHPRDYSQSMPKKMRCLAIRSALSAKMRDERVIFMDGLSDVEPKTKAMKEVLDRLPESRSFLIVMPEKIEAIERAAGNLPNVRTMLASYLNVRDLLKYDRIIVTQGSVEIIENLWALPEEKRELSVWKQARLAARASARRA